MALNRFRIYLPLVALSFAAPSLCQAGIVNANGTCEVGDCHGSNVLSYGSTTGQQPFSFFYRFPNTDTFKVAGLYSASSSSSGTQIEFNVRAYYLGNSTHTASANDTLVIDLLQIYDYPFDLNGTYSYSNSFHVGKFVSPNSTAQTDLYYEGRGVGVIGPFTGPGNFSGSASADIGGLTHPLSADYRYTFFIAAGSVTAAADAEVSGSEEDQSANSNAVQVTGSGGSRLKGTTMNKRQDEKAEVRPDDQDLANRRDLVRKLGKFAAYAAPFTILASTGKAIGGHGSGGGPSRPVR